MRQLSSQMPWHTHGFQGYRQQRYILLHCYFAHSSAFKGAAQVLSHRCVSPQQQLCRWLHVAVRGSRKHIPCMQGKRGPGG